MTKTPEGILIQAVGYERVRELIDSTAVQLIEEPIAQSAMLEIIRESSPVSLEMTKADLSVGGIPIDDFEAYLDQHRDQIIKFGTCIARDQSGLTDEYPEGESQDPPGDRKIIGLAAGFGITHAIFFHYTTETSGKELRAYLKNRRIPKHTKFAKQLESFRDRLLK